MKNMGYKMAILIRQDLKLPKGKAAAQAAHASVEAVLKSNNELVKTWRKEGMTKIVLKVKDLKTMLSYNQKAKDLGLTTAVITDAGKTTVAPQTKTCVAIGPDTENNIDKIIKNLKLF